MTTKKKTNTSVELQEATQNADVQEATQNVELQEEKAVEPQEENCSVRKEAVCCVGESRDIPRFDDEASVFPKPDIYGVKYTGDKEIVAQVNACAKKGLELANKLFENAMRAAGSSSVINENQIKNVNLAIELFNAFKY